MTKRAERNDRMMKALSHPVRMRSLAILSEKVASPNMLAKELEEPLGVVSYHVRCLLDLDCIELVKTEPRRGATEHYYRATDRPFFDDPEWNVLPREGRAAVSAGILSEVWRDISSAVASASFDSRPDRHLSWTNLSLDDEAWEQLMAKLAELLEFANELQAQSAGRADPDSPPTTSKLVLMHYPAAAETEAPKPAGAKASRRKTKPVATR